MARIIMGGAVLVLALALAGCGKPAEDPSASSSVASPAASASVATAGAKPPAFAQCAACHSVEKGMHGVGPSLAGIFGTKAGDVPGYAFSDAMKASGLVWDEKTLDTYLTNPMKVVPGTRMTYAGMSDPADRKAVIDYLKTLK
ncbi:MAG: c-type cytochrome [Novosphingobium sp.]|uniref:c-type cytochrome n=1 Tax=Novosphingobium sp. TaxID=1874826 RepID=UPI003C7CF170